MVYAADQSIPRRLSGSPVHLCHSQGTIFTSDRKLFIIVSLTGVLQQRVNDA
jgi:hypothetical protein